MYITVSHKTAEEMAAQYGFNEEQKGYLAELLADENNSLWSQVLYGITGGDGQIVTVALSQVGNVGGQPYWSWYGFNSRVEWCACFVIQIEQTETRHPVNRWSWRNSRHAPWIQARMTAVMGGASQVPVDMRKMGGTRQAR